MITKKERPISLTEEQLLGRACFIKDYVRNLTACTKSLPKISHAAALDVRKDLDEAIDLLESLALQLSLLAIPAHR
jgi:hypothetical protein